MNLFFKRIRKLINEKFNIRSKSKNLDETEPFKPPAHFIKQSVINDIRKKYGYEILVETGTYLGDMVEAQKLNFKKIFSIELGKELHENALVRFKNDKNVYLIYGDSGKVLPQLMTEISECAIFWLDGHYSEGVTAKGEKECPIYEELQAIFNSTDRKHILLIDDARLFVGKNDYPTLADLTNYIKKFRPASKLQVKNDIIQVVLIS